VAVQEAQVGGRVSVLSPLADTAGDIVRGAVDLYQHANPDLLPRRGDDVELAEEAKGAGLAAIVHRHHFSPTAERATLARRQTGFPILGAILLNDSVGGLNPTAVELALEMGAVWIGLPTLSAQAQRDRLARMPTRRAQALTFGPGRLTLTDADGKLLPAVHEILDLARSRQVTVNVGYAGFADCQALIRSDRSLKAVITNPLTTMGLSFDQLDELLEGSALVVEQTAYSLHPSGSYGGGHEAVERAAEIVRRVGPGRLALSSDGGMEDAPGPAELLTWACCRLLEAGIGEDDVYTMTHGVPGSLVGASRANLYPGHETH
jgi:Family of unknown function (DUF6282)